MIQYIAEFPCPHCQHSLRIKQEYLGKTLRCKYCAHEFPTEAGNGTASSHKEAAEREKEAALGRLGTLEAELQLARNELASQTAQHGAAIQAFQITQAELARLQEQFQQAWAAQEEVVDLRQKLSAAQSQVNEFRAHVPTLPGAPMETGPGQAERDTDGNRVDLRQTPPPNSTALHPGGEGPARERAAVPRNLLLEKAQSLRARIEASSTIKERVESLNAELDAARAEKDRLNAELQTAVAQAEQCRAQIGELQQSLAELTKAHGDLSGVEADRRQLQEQFDAARQAHGQELAALRSELEQLRQEIAALRQERDASVNQMQLLTDERNRFAAERDEIDSRYKEAIERFRADFARLTQAWQQSRHLETSTAEQNRGLAQQVDSLRAELDQQLGRATAHEQTISTLQQAVETALAEATAERERSSNALEQEKARAEAERQKWQEQLEGAQRRFDETTKSLQTEVERLREEITACQEALEIVGLVAE